MPGVELIFFLISSPIDMNRIHNGDESDKDGMVSGVFVPRIYLAPTGHVLSQRRSKLGTEPALTSELLRFT